MSDLTDRLRNAMKYDLLAAAANEAADEIDRLREQLTLAESVRAAQVAGLTEGAEKVQQDAARYRWLRDWAQSSDWEYIGWQRETDKAVDAARAALKGER